MPARRRASQQGLSPCWLHCSHPIRHTQIVLLAIVGDSQANNICPTLQITTLTLNERLTSFVVRTTIHHPPEPFAPESMYEEIKQTSKADTNDWINLTAIPITLDIEFMVQQRSYLQCAGSESIILSFLIVGINCVQVDFSQVAVKVLTDNFTTRVQTIATHTMI